jgi:hypothetical protein
MAHQNQNTEAPASSEAYKEPKDKTPEKPASHEEPKPNTTSKTKTKSPYCYFDNTTWFEWDEDEFESWFYNGQTPSTATPKRRGTGEIRGVGEYFLAYFLL